MTGAVVDELTIDHHNGNSAAEPDSGDPGPGGTIVTVRHRLAHPARLVADNQTSPGPRSTVDFAAHLHPGPQRVPSVRGSIDIITAG